MKFSSLTFCYTSKKTEIMKCYIYHFVFILRLANMILHHELFTRQTLPSSLEIAQLILLQVNFNSSLIYVVSPDVLSLDVFLLLFFLSQ